VYHDAGAGSAAGDHVEEDTQLMALLWQEQQDALKKGRQHQWHPDVINWCLSIWLRSHSAYSDMADSGFLRLPSTRTLQRHANKIDVTAGIAADRITRLASHAEQLRDAERICMLVFDEMHMR
jgi:hypothetical protein